MTQFSCHFRVIKPNLEAIHIALMIQEASLHMSYGLTFFFKEQPTDSISCSIELLKLCSSKAIISYALHGKHMPQNSSLGGEVS